MARPKSQTVLARAFRQEINCWRLGFEEECLVRMFVACLSERMKGNDPALLTQSHPTEQHDSATLDDKGNLGRDRTTGTT